MEKIYKVLLVGFMIFVLWMQWDLYQTYKESQVHHKEYIEFLQSKTKE